MLFALLLALLAVPALLLWRAWAADAAGDERVRQLIDLSVGDPPAAARLLREHPELLRARYLHDETPLHFCAVEGLVDGVRFLAKAGVPIDAKNRFGDTALVDAVTLGRLEVVRVLLAHGADPNASSLTRGPVLHDAIAHGHAELAGILLDAGASPDAHSALGGTLWDAVPRLEPHRSEVLEALERRGLRP